MKLTTESDYGLRGLVALARRPPGAVMKITEIAALQHIPRGFLAKIFTKFARAGLVRSFRGPVPGFTLAKIPESMTLQEILEAIEGRNLFQRCAFWNNRCNEKNPCLLHHQWSAVRPSLALVTLKDLIAAEGSRGRRRRGEKTLKKGEG